MYIDYEIKISSPYIEASTAEKINLIFSNDLYITKKSKGNEKEINIKEYIKSLKSRTSDDKIVIDAIIASGSEKNLNPELLIEAIKQNIGILTTSPISEYYTIMRKDMLCEDLTKFQ